MIRARERMNRKNAQRDLHSRESDSPLVNPAHTWRRCDPGDYGPFPRETPLLTDVYHPIIQRIADLRQRACRDRSGHYYVEGLRFVIQAVQRRASLDALVVCRRLLVSAAGQRLVRQQRQLGVPILDVTPAVLHQLTAVENPQGIGAIVRQRWEPLERITPGAELCWIALHAVHSAGNLGTILRTAVAVGNAGLFVLGDDVDPYDPAAVRATMGALYAQRLVRTTAPALEEWKRRHRLLLVGTSPTAPTDYQTRAYHAPTILLMGEERKGLPASLTALCDDLVRIPMVGGSDSLNLGVATGIMLYELFNQRRHALRHAELHEE
jgi:TrmH family RNA methyltransferase